jgi:penicillin-binding protein 2
MFQKRVLILACLFACGFVLIVARLVQLQVMDSEEYRQQGASRRHRLIQIPPRRGKILDSRGRALAEDQPSYDLWLIPAQVDYVDGKRAVVSQLGELSPDKIVRLARSSGRQRELDYDLAFRELVETSSLVRNLAQLMKQEDEAVARVVLDACLDRLADSEQDLTVPRLLFENVEPRVYLAVEKERGNPYGDPAFQSLETHVGMRRVYPAGEIMGHITGYVGRLSREEYATLRGEWVDGNRVGGQGVISYQGRTFFALEPEGEEMQIVRLRQRTRRGELEHYAGYFANETVGRGGVEQYYNQRLRGRHVQRLLRLEKTGAGGQRQLSCVGEPHPARDGVDIRLTIDLEQQRKIHGIMLEELEKLRLEHRGREGKPYAGVCLLMNPETGAIYALISVPGFDPNTLAADFPELLKDERTPLLNRVIAGQYPPGSVMKPLIALGALSEGVIQPDTTFCCEGVITLKNHDFICMRRVHHGNINVEDALRSSCNVFFYHAGQALGSKKIFKWAWDLSLGHETGIDISGERPGYLPPSAMTGRRWSTGQTYHFSIGQGALTVTPLQMAVAFAAIANGGRIVQPHVLDSPQLSQSRAELAPPTEALETVRLGMWKVVQDPHGSARKARLRSFDIAGKTGSAEWKKAKATHAWFGCYAPFEKPEVVCIVLVPEGNFGGGTCAPIAKRILQAYFGLSEDDAVEEEAVG